MAHITPEYLKGAHKALKDLGFVCRVTISHGGAGRKKQGDSSRNFWRLVGISPGPNVEQERTFFIRCTSEEIQAVIYSAQMSKLEQKLLDKATDHETHSPTSQITNPPPCNTTHSATAHHTCVPKA